VSWAEIKKAINDSVGRKRFKPLDRIVKQETYERFYDLAVVQGNLNVGIVGRELIDGVNIGDVNSIYDGNSTVEKVIFPWGIYATSIQCCRNAVNLSHLIIPDTVTEISDHSFYGCNKLKTVKLSDSLKTIGRGAFADSGLEYIKIPEGVTSIDSTAFQNCPNLKVIDVGFAQGDVAGAPWGATNATVSYNIV
jgi:hypothetical protein